MKKLFTGVLFLTLCCVVAGFGQSTEWQFAKVFPDTSFAPGAGVHGIAVDPDGKIWVGPAGVTNNDSLPNGKKTVSIYVFNPDGSEAAISRIKYIDTPGRSDTLTALCRGMRADMDGNIVYVSGANYWKLDYKTGAGIYWVQPNTGSAIAPAFDNDNEMFTGNVVPGNDIKIWGSDFGPLGTAVTGALGYSRCLEVSKDGNDIYWCGYSIKQIQRYHSDIGSIGTYTLADSFALSCQVESIGWNPKDGYLYASSGNVDTADYGTLPSPPFKVETWYAFGPPPTYTVYDSITWDRAAYPYDYNNTLNSPRPRGIAFTGGGDTAYVACFNHSKGAIQMFVRTLVSVEPVSDLVPHAYTLSQNYPNPFNPSTQIEFSIPKAGFTTVKVYDVLGKEVATLVNESLNPGTFKTTLDGSKLSSGTYIYRLVSGTTQITKKMMLIK